jgi:hypothetical protein
MLALSVGVTACSLKASSSTPTENTNSTANTNATAPSEPAATPNGGSAQSQTTLPEVLVAELYKQHDAKKSPFFQTKDRALVDKYFTKPLADLIWKDATTAKNEVGAIDGDPLYNAQETEIKNFSVGKGEIKGDKATVAVTFTNVGEKKTVNFELKQVGGSWKIDNILYGKGDSLMKWLTDTYPANPKKDSGPTGEFEGKYQVGPTTCTVKPVKMAFEVSWAKGKGVEMYFFKEGWTFESEGKENDKNTFVFDDENYNTGTFHRADGSAFAVKRMK